MLRFDEVVSGTEERLQRAHLSVEKMAWVILVHYLLDSRAGNRDPSVFAHAHEVDFDRDPNPQITFGRGFHSCLGQQFARMELRVLWNTLLTRLPSIRLAVPPEEVPWRPADSATIGPAHLPVTWG